MLDLKVPIRKTNLSQKVLSYIGPSAWDKLLYSMKRKISLNTSKHDVQSNTPIIPNTIFEMLEIYTLLIQNTTFLKTIFFH